MYYFYKRIDSHWQIQDSSYDFARIFISPEGKLYRYGIGGVQQKIGHTWTTVLQQLATVGMGSATENSIFAVGYYGPNSTGRVYHYNGTNWFEYTKLRMDGVDFQSVWTDGKEVFVVGFTLEFPMKTIVLHGK